MIWVILTVKGSMFSPFLIGYRIVTCRSRILINFFESHSVLWIRVKGCVIMALFMLATS